MGKNREELLLNNSIILKACLKLTFLLTSVLYCSFHRISLNGMKVSRPDARIGRYRMIKHERDRHNEPNPQR